jgi:hypothetical protein
MPQAVCDYLSVSFSVLIIWDEKIHIAPCIYQTRILAPLRVADLLVY